MTDIKRRKFVSLMTAGAAVIPVSALVASLPSHAADAPVDPESAQAKALQYVSESEKSDQKCGNCTLYSGAEGADMGACPLFQGASVMSEAWCSAYVPAA